MAASYVVDAAAADALLAGAGLRAVRLALGPHPVAGELRALGLPRRAVLTSAVPRLGARFWEATPVGP